MLLKKFEKKKKKSRTSIPKSKGILKKKTKNGAIELRNSESEEEVIIKLQLYEIETLITIYCVMVAEIIKSTRKNICNMKIAKG